MERDIPTIGKSLIQAAIGLFIFALVLFVFFLIAYLLDIFLKITLWISKDDLYLILTILATIGTAIYIYNLNQLDDERKNIRRQKDLLRLLLSELKFLEGNLKSYIETFSKDSHYPLYELWNINHSLYFDGLDYELRGQKTLGLKENLIKIKDKVLIVNNFKIETKKLEEERGHEKIIIAVGAVKMNREQIIKIVKDDILPVIEESKRLISGFLKD